MTNDEFRDCIATLEWTVCGLARRLGVDENRVRRWASGRYPVPEEVALWLKRLVGVLQRYPTPKRLSESRRP